METLNNYSNVLDKIEHEEKWLLYVMSEGCTVCHADQPKVQQLVNQHDIDGYQITINDMPEAAGQLSLFASPVVILFNKGKEFHRQARIIDFNQLERSIEQLKAW